MNINPVPVQGARAEQDLLRKTTTMVLDVGRRFVGTYEGMPVFEDTEGHVAFGLPDDAVQELFDDLWRLGVRPSTRDPATAVAKHLEDMRQLAFSALEIPKPEDSNG